VPESGLPQLRLPSAEFLKTYSGSYLTARPLVAAVLSDTISIDVPTVLAAEDAAEVFGAYLRMVFQDHVVAEPEAWWDAILPHIHCEMVLRSQYKMVYAGRAANEVPAMHIVKESRVSGIATASLLAKSTREKDHATLIQTCLSEETCFAHDMVRVISPQILDIVRQSPSSLALWLTDLARARAWEKDIHCLATASTTTQPRVVLQELLSPPAQGGFTWLTSTAIHQRLAEEASGRHAEEGYPDGYATYFVVWALQWHPLTVRASHEEVVKTLMNHCNKDVRLEVIRSLGKTGQVPREADIRTAQPDASGDTPRVQTRRR